MAEPTSHEARVITGFLEEYWDIFLNHCHDLGAYPEEVLAAISQYIS